jgi:N-dimethylarginine dimethylaminohydrolase
VTAAYHGATWSPRTGTLREEIAANAHWSARVSDSEYRRLREVVLAPPRPDLPTPPDPDAVQHEAPVDFQVLHRELMELAACYERLGIDVHLLTIDEQDDCCRPDTAAYNLMFARDLFFMTPEGAVLSRMASTVRAGEERYAAHKLASLHVPLLRMIHGTGTAEGADVLWARPDLVLVGTGNRTNAEGYRQISACLADQQVRVVEIPIPRQVQHLLGLVQIVDRDLAVVRTSLAGETTVRVLRDIGMSIVDIPESVEVRKKQGMNLVTIAPRTVVLPTGAEATRNALHRAGVEVAAQVDISELTKAAGGIGCATAILRRETTTSPGGQ